MKLCTECHWEGWDRILDIYSDMYEALPVYINADDRYKIIILEKGCIMLEQDGIKSEVKAPAIILLSQKDKITYKIVKAIKAYVTFFDPAVIRDEFTYERIDSGEFENMIGQVIYQDYLLIRDFAFREDKAHQIIPLPMTGFKHIKGLYISMDNQLKGQKDGFWPCRSRSFLMEILHFIVYSYFIISPDQEENEETYEQEKFAEIAEYLEQNMSEPITLEKLTKQFAINRNKLNAIFEKQASMTCLNYLLKLRMDLATILLSKTELPVGEIGARVGFPDPNYFTKVFKSKTGKTPTKFRYP